MKRIILLFAFLVSIISCHKDNISNGDNSVLIKGKIGGATKGGLSAADSKEGSLPDAKRVVVVIGERYDIVEIENGSFSVDAPVGSATALIFVDSNNQYIGNLTVSGLNILPLVNLSDGENTVIDLSTLTLYGTSVVPANNPIGTEIMISERDIEMLREIGSYFESISKNTDIDNDGILDIFSGKQVMLNTEFMLTAGKYGVNSSTAVLKDSSDMEINYSLRIAGKKPLVPPVVNVSLSGPEGNPHNDIVKRGYSYYDNCECFIAGFMRQAQGQVEGPQETRFRKGIYTFSMDGINNLTLYYSSISAKYFLLLAVPVIKTNSEGIITSVEIEYMHPDGTPVNYSNYLTTLAIQFKSTPSSVLHQEGSIYDLMNKLPDFENVTISRPMNINEITNITISYTDLVGNLYGIHWTNQ
jgi:hypothetical protein